ncbi:excinuclease ATPase subunit [Paucibacter sp. R3-3]|uniref:Excinuclease ATPase subunit n=1 Tax=Roseateles agri TaxID=3098619 RepID=A0ABU5DFY8_9BURK|nr:excinuclease ATPase subunit [Paucibacter sp. R3-3]MDY0745044.1 excinuclease ATPase subunit [Paucibacter sp. R3-3]
MQRLPIALALALASLAPLAQARDTIVDIPLADVLAMPEAQSELDGSVKFYLAGAATPHVAKRLGSDVSNPKTNGFNKSDEFGCKWAALSALKAFQAKAKSKGANAVVDLVSYYKRNETRSDTTIQCHAGAFVIGLALKGEYAVVK